jgi:hypothetical protein
LFDLLEDSDDFSFSGFDLAPEKISDLESD